MKECEGLEGQALADYCRGKGVYLEEVKPWHASLSGAPLASPSPSRGDGHWRRRAYELERENQALRDGLSRATRGWRSRRCARCWGMAAVPGNRGRKAPAAERARALCAIAEAVSSGTDLAVACADAGVNVRTHWRWKASRGGEDGRQAVAARRAEGMRFGAEVRTEVLRVCALPEYADLPPGQIVADLADREGRYGGVQSFVFPRRIRQREGERVTEQPSPDRAG